MDKLPYFKFFTGDWAKDPHLQTCSLGARGLWVELLILMFNSDKKGYLLIAGKSPDLPTLALMVRASIEDCTAFFGELEVKKVFKKDAQGVIYSKKMIQEDEEHQKKSAYGKMGGNPKLMVNFNQSFDRLFKTSS